MVSFFVGGCAFESPICARKGFLGLKNADLAIVNSSSNKFSGGCARYLEIVGFRCNPCVQQEDHLGFEGNKYPYFPLLYGATLLLLHCTVSSPFGSFPPPL